MTKIALQNNVSENSSKKLDSITKDIITETSRKKHKFDFGAIHLYGGIEIPELKFENLIVNSELIYELGNVDVGIKGTAELKVINNEKKYFFNYLLKLRYRFF